MSKWRWLLLKLTRELWFRATLLGILGVAAAIIALLSDRFIPEKFPFSISEDAISSLLTIIATSMLTVTTFSLGVMSSTFATAASTVTPRATKLLAEDRLSQNVLANFIGAFLFGIVGLVALKAGAYDENGRVVLFVFTIAILALVVIYLMRWIDHLMLFGRVSDTTERVENATKTAIETRLINPYLGGHPLGKFANNVPPTAIAITAYNTGHVINIEMPKLSDYIKEHGGRVIIAAIPGTFVYEGSVLAWIDLDQPASDEDELIEEYIQAFTISNDRTFDQDPRFGITVLSEIAQRALSPAINDPGTAIDVIGRQARLLTLWGENMLYVPPEECDYPQIYVPQLATRDLFQDAFQLIAREGAAHIEVQIRLRRALNALSGLGDADFREAAIEQADKAMRRAEKNMELKDDLEALKAIKIGS